VERPHANDKQANDIDPPDPLPIVAVKSAQTAGENDMLAVRVRDGFFLVRCA
jgi:hypothetical protein